MFATRRIYESICIHKKKLYTECLNPLQTHIRQRHIYNKRLIKIRNESRCEMTKNNKNATAYICIVDPLTHIDENMVISLTIIATVKTCKKIFIRKLFTQYRVDTNTHDKKHCK